VIQPRQDSFFSTKIPLALLEAGLNQEAGRIPVHPKISARSGSMEIFSFAATVFKPPAGFGLASQSADALLGLATTSDCHLAILRRSSP